MHTCTGAPAASNLHQGHLGMHAAHARAHAHHRMPAGDCRCQQVTADASSRCLCGQLTFGVCFAMCMCVCVPCAQTTFKEPAPPDTALTIRSKVISISEGSQPGKDKTSVEVDVLVVGQNELGQETVLCHGTGIHKRLGALRAL